MVYTWIEYSCSETSNEKTRTHYHNSVRAAVSRVGGRTVTQIAGFAFAVIIRVVVGILFMIAAPSCRLSDVIYVAGVFIITVAVLLAIAGPKRFEALFGWWTGLAAFEIRAWAFVSALFCGFLIYASGWSPIG